MHSWWGPAYLLLFAIVWALTGSYTALQLVVPVAAGVVVLLTYLFAVRFFNSNTALLAVVLLAWFPSYRETAVIAMVEPLSAVLILAALWCFLTQRTWATVLLGMLAVYGKIDLILLYFGTVTLVTLLSWRDATRLPLRHVAISLIVPALALAPWMVYVYGVLQRPTTVSGGSNLAMLQMMLPLMLDQVYLIWWPIAIIGVVIPLLMVAVALLRRSSAAPLVYRALGVWVALGLIIFTVYMATPGASNNPRILIPALPALFLLVADGLVRVHARIRLVAVSYLLFLYLLANLSSASAQIVQGQYIRSMLPVWEALRQAPHGVILTEQYWSAALFARQPATWFEHDNVFQRNILWNETNFVRYLAQAPIRYVVLPDDDQRFRERFAEHPLEQWRRSLPMGRMSDWPTESFVAPEVRSYLERTFPRTVIGDYVVFTVSPPGGR